MSQLSGLRWSCWTLYLTKQKTKRIKHFYPCFLFFFFFLVFKTVRSPASTRAWSAFVCRFFFFFRFLFCFVNYFWSFESTLANIHILGSILPFISSWSCLHWESKLHSSLRLFSQSLGNIITRGLLVICLFRHSCLACHFITAPCL